MTAARRSPRLRHSLVPLLALLLAGSACSDPDTGVLNDNIDELIAEARGRPSSRVGSDHTAAEVGQFREAGCEFESELAPAPRCGWLTVPMVREIGGEPVDERTIAIHVAVYPAWGDDPRADPIIYLEGGPGVSALNDGDLTAEWLWRLNADRDLILFDQRGLGASTPGLECREVDAAWAKLPADATEELAIERERAAAAVCRARLSEEGIEVSAYNTVSAAHDVADLRVALGIEQWNVLGVSYGTRLGQTLVRERPEGIRAVILDGSYPLDDDPLFSVPRTGAHALGRLFGACESDDRCRSAHPDLEERFRSMVEQLDARPLDVNFGGVEDTWVFPVTGRDIVDAAALALYDAYSFVDLPRLVDTYEAGEDWGISSFVGGPLGGLGDGDTLGTFLSVNCRDEIAFSRTPIPLPADVLAGDHEQYVDDNLNACEIWDVGRARAVENEPVHSDLPTLVLVGTFDPITPVEHAREVAATFTSSTFVEFGDRGHGTLGDRCADGIALAFLDAPDAELELDCVQQLDGPVFVPSGPGDLELVEITTAGDPTISSMAPFSWYENEDAWLRDRSLLDFAGLRVEGYTDSSVDAEVDALRTVYGREVRRRTTTDHAGLDWVVMGTVYLGDFVDIAVTEVDDVTMIITLTTAVDERTAVTDAIWLDVLTATRPR